MGLTKTASSAVNLLIDIGYFPVHVNLDLLKLGIPTNHSEEIILAAESLLADSSDVDEVSLLYPIFFLKCGVDPLHSIFPGLRPLEVQCELMCIINIRMEVDF